LGASIAEVSATLAPAIGARGLECTTSVDDAQLHAWADPDKLRQILFNVVTNAVKFTPPGGRITIDADAHGTEVSIRVRDTGIGIPTGRIDQIFEPFVQLDSRGHGQREGVGLGLSISRALARGMGGDLVAESSAGEGATFTIRLRQSAA
jgi:signal transduction histidine kinase